MNTNLLALASGLSDHDLLARLVALAASERAASVELVAHLAVLDARPSLYAAQGYGSLFGYCTRALRLSEDATCNRIAAARTCRKFPVVLELLSSGAMSFTSVRMLSPCLTAENHEAVLARASGRGRSEIEALIAELAPRPDVPSSVRKLPAAPAARDTLCLIVPETPRSAEARERPLVPAAPPSLPPIRRPIVEMTSPERYRVQFTIGKDTQERLRRLQTLLRREIPDGDPAVIFDRALILLLERVEGRKRGATRKPQSPRAIRPGADTRSGGPTSRHIPAAVQRASACRDGDQCTFVSKDGNRCTERAFLEFHHLKPYAQGGLATVDNITLRCRRHNQYEGELIFGRGRRRRAAVDRPLPVFDAPS